MTGDVPVTLAGTAAAWTPRAPDMRFDIGHEGRLRRPMRDTYPKGNTGPKPKLHDTLTRIRQSNKRLAALRFD